MGDYILAVILLILDIICIFPAALHFKYDITYRQFTVKRLIYPNISFPCDTITAIENATMFTAWGGRSTTINMNQIVEDSMGAYKITYSVKNHKRKSVIVCPKDNIKFINELALYVDRQVIWINNTESAFKKKKDGL